MVMGHTLDAVLSPAARQTRLMVQYWHVRGFTAPLFLLVSGWAVTLAIARSGARGWAVPRGRLRRVALLLGIGYALRWPGWALGGLRAGDRDVWAHFLAFDALHCIAVALLVTSLVLALPGPKAVKGGLLGALAAAAVLLGGGALVPGAAPASAAGLPRSLPAMALAQALGGTSSFPLLPWAAYFFAGTVVGLVAPPGRRGVVITAIAGMTLLVVTTQWAGLANRPPGDPVLVAFRAGVVLWLLAALSLVPGAAASRAAPLGRRSLGVYALHLPVVYGWSTHPGLSYRIGQALGPGAALGVALAVLGVSFVIYRGLALGARAVAERVIRPRPRPPPAVAP